MECLWCRATTGSRPGDHMGRLKSVPPVPYTTPFDLHASSTTTKHPSCSQICLIVELIPTTSFIDFLLLGGAFLRSLTFLDTLPLLLRLVHIPRSYVFFFFSFQKARSSWSSTAVTLVFTMSLLLADWQVRPGAWFFCIYYAGHNSASSFFFLSDFACSAVI